MNYYNGYDEATAVNSTVTSLINDDSIISYQTVSNIDDGGDYWYDTIC